MVIHKSKINRILIRATNWVGDVVMTLPALEAVRECFPKSNISILAKPWVIPLFEAHPMVDEVIPIEKAEETWAASVHFNLEISRTDRETLVDLHAILERHPGSCPGFLHLRSPEKTDSIIALPETLRVKAGTSLRREVHRFLGYTAVETHCRPATAAATNGLHRNGRDRRPPNGGYRR